MTEQLQGGGVLQHAAVGALLMAAARGQRGLGGEERAPRHRHRSVNQGNPRRGIDKLQAEPPSKEELSGIQNYLAGTYVLQNSSRGGITNQLDYMDLHALPPTYASTYVKQVYAVTPQQISEMARKHLLDDKALIVIVGDRKVIEEQVKGFGTIMEK